MTMFGTRKPRRFNLRPIYSGRPTAEGRPAPRQLGIRRPPRRNFGSRLSPLAIVLAIVVLLLLARYIMTGEWAF